MSEPTISMESYYALLNITERASTSEIRAAFRRKALQHHPDKGGNAQLFVRIRDAHDILTDPWKRMTYDVQLNVLRRGAQSKVNKTSADATFDRMSSRMENIDKTLDEINEKLDRVSIKLDECIEILKRYQGSAGTPQPSPPPPSRSTREPDACGTISGR